MFTVHLNADRNLVGEIAALEGIETATLGHILGSGFMIPQIQCALEGKRACGPAMTVSLPGDDGTALAHAIRMARRGDILVVDADAARALQNAEPGIIARIQAGERIDEINGAGALIAKATRKPSGPA